MIDDSTTIRINRFQEAEVSAHLAKPYEHRDRAFSALSKEGKEAIAQSADRNGLSVQLSHPQGHADAISDLAALADAATRVINFPLADLFFGEYYGLPWAIVVQRG